MYDVPIFHLSNQGCCNCEVSLPIVCLGLWFSSSTRSKPYRKPCTETTWRSGTQGALSHTLCTLSRPQKEDEKAQVTRSRCGLRGSIDIQYVRTVLSMLEGIRCAVVP